MIREYFERVCHVELGRGDRIDVSYRDSAFADLCIDMLVQSAGQEARLLLVDPHVEFVLVWVVHHSVDGLPFGVLHVDQSLGNRHPKRRVDLARVQIGRIGWP